MNGSTWDQIREFCGRLFSRGKQGMETMKESLDRQAQIQRLAGQVRGLSRERSNLVTAIGKKVYTLHTRGKVKNKDVLGDCLRIDQIREEITDLKRQIEEIRLATVGEMPEIDLEDESFLADEEAEELVPEDAEGPSPEQAPCVEPALEVDEAEGQEDESAGEPAGV